MRQRILLGRAFGIEVAGVGTGAALSAPVEQAVAGVVAAVRSELRRLAAETV